ncbi:DUF2017 domain-containing protein [Demetria terragena]|uniref:DUF2017 domain-containing protein n=1 Tax=Demetria terragena TaxID=63959 RepID=UPI00037045DF|nr:DUF2017 domain-containing protein [Demetria terragena]
MATAFRRKGSRVVGKLDGQERSLLIGLMESTLELLDATDLADKDQAPDDDDFATLMRQLEARQISADEVAGRDPALQRLLPSASRDDDELARDFRSMTEDSLRQRKAANLNTTIGALHAATAGRVELDLGQAQAMMIALTDVRLVLAERLGIHTEEDSEEIHALVEDGLDEGDPRLIAASIYDLLTWMQETIAQALLR